MNQDEHKIVVRRMAGLIAAASVLIAVYVLRLIFLQLVNSDSFKAQATNTTDYNFTVTAARGDIVDSAGRRIAASTTSYNVVLSKLLMGDEDLDTMLQRIVELLEAHGEKWNDSLLISEPDAAGHYSFTAQADSTGDQKALAAMKDSLGLQQYATADDVMEKLVEDYKLEGYPFHWQRVLGGIHYEMQQQAFSNVNNFVMAENVSEVTVATIKENSLTMPGVEIVETSTRSYDEGGIIPHVLGRVGKITAEKWKVTDENGQTTYPLREKGYNMNDMIGVSGLEAVYEDELRGKDGVETITRSSDGVIVGTAMTTVPEPGHTVQLTIDSAFQQAVDRALAKNIEMINSTYNNSSSAKAAAGAVVVISTKDGSVLAASNYPSYDQNLFATQYSQYSSDPGLPLLNRALQGLYTPGSTFKPAVAVAALDSGVINRSSTVYCNGVYTYYDDYRPKCTRHGHSGNIDVITAIKWSCNIFFYDVGRRTTSDVYDAYAYKMGLGTRTGVEVNEATGRLTTKKDSNYIASLDVQAAIGQGNTVVTPVQLATYAGTLANRGVRYRTHFVKAILDTNTGKVLQETQPEVMDVIEDRGDTFDLVRQGMIGVSETVSGLKNYPSYDQNLFATQYSQYSSDPGLPLLNRALQGLYTPGSTFKPAVAVAALDSGVINRSSTVYCNGVYTYYDDYRPKCTRHGHSGNIDVITAIKWSCNIFFYDVGRRTTSDVYDAYAYKMGLGTRTGVEVNEATGRLTTKKDSNYIASLDVQAAIGQGNTVVTPVQLATYAGTLANRGVRYRTHFVKAILDTNTGKVLQETQPEVMDVIEDRGDTFDLVRQGMIGVSETVSGLKNYPVTIACKTGTPQRSETYYVGSTRKHYTNTMMVAYGPAEDAEIALGSVIEYGGGGARAGNLVADIFDAYYAMKDGSLTLDETGAGETADTTADGQDAVPETVENNDALADDTAPAEQPAA